MNDRVVKDIALIASLLDGKVKFNINGFVQKSECL